MKRVRPVHWLLGALLGIGLGFDFLEAGYRVALLILVVLLGAWLIARSAAFESGILIGTGGTIAAILGRASSECARDASCVMPDVGPWVLAALGLVVVGLVLGGVGLRTKSGDAWDQLLTR